MFECVIVVIILILILFYCCYFYSELYSFVTYDSYVSNCNGIFDGLCQSVRNIGSSYYSSPCPLLLLYPWPYLRCSLHCMNTIACVEALSFGSSLTSPTNTLFISVDLYPKLPPTMMSLGFGVHHVLEYTFKV
ncbi:hypothetical protein AMTRI_Chr01g126870 [Amborella trichopoda]